MARGRREGNNKLRVVESKLWLHISRLSQETEEQDIIDYLKENGIEGNIDCQELSNRNTDKAFKIGVPLKYKEIIYNEDLWPSGIKFRPFRAPWKFSGPK